MKQKETKPKIKKRKSVAIKQFKKVSIISRKLTQQDDQRK